MNGPQGGGIHHLHTVVVAHHHAPDQLRYQRATRPRQIRAAHFQVLGEFRARETRMGQPGLQYSGKLFGQQPDGSMSSGLPRCLA